MAGGVVEGLRLGSRSAWVGHGGLGRSLQAPGTAEQGAEKGTRGNLLPWDSGAGVGSNLLGPDCRAICFRHNGAQQKYEEMPPDGQSPSPECIPMLKA